MVLADSSRLAAGRSVARGRSLFRQATPVIELLPLPCPQGEVGIAQIGHEGGREAGCVRRRLGGGGCCVRPQHKGRIAEQADAPERHAGHPHIDDHLNEWIRRHLDQFDETRVQLARSRRLDLRRQLERAMPAGTDALCRSPVLSVSSRSSSGPSVTFTYHTQLIRPGHVRLPRRVQG